ncbi:hypothetical protein KM043_015438 [Ampulex compressa]|nr:hypothetical protein KM043_015438 [Ampulex compressa]
MTVFATAATCRRPRTPQRTHLQRIPEIRRVEDSVVAEADVSSSERLTLRIAAATYHVITSGRDGYSCEWHVSRTSRSTKPRENQSGPPIASERDTVAYERSKLPVLLSEGDRRLDGALEAGTKNVGRMSGASGLKPPALYSRPSNGTKPKSRICKLTSPRSLISVGAGSSPRKQSESSVESPSSSPGRSAASSTSPRRTPLDSPSRRSPRRSGQQVEDRQALQQVHSPRASPKRSPRRFLSSFEDERPLEEMGIGPEEPTMSFLEFESLYTLEKELMQRQEVGQLDEKCIFAGWFGRRGLYTELPDPLCQQVVQPVTPSQIPTEGFSFAPGWSLNVEHFYQWHHRGRSTQQEFTMLAASNARQRGSRTSVFPAKLGELAKYLRLCN